MTTKQIRETRKARGLTQEQAAAEINVTVFTWSRWETGRTAPMGLYARALEGWINTPGGAT